MRGSQTPSTYNEPTVMWRMQRGDRLLAHLVIAPTGPSVIVVLFVNSQPMRMREFDNWADAITWSDRMRDQNWTAGWRLTPDATA